MLSPHDLCTAIGDFPAILPDRKDDAGSIVNVGGAVESLISHRQEQLIIPFPGMGGKVNGIVVFGIRDPAKAPKATVFPFNSAT